MIKKILALLKSREGAIDDFGINFASDVLRKFYETAVAPVVTNTDYEGEIKEFGDRVRILSFLHDIAVSDYTASSDMGMQTLYDTSEELVINQQKYYNFSIDKVQELFTQASPSDMKDALIENSAKEIAKIIDGFVLLKLADGVRAGNWVGQNVHIIGYGVDTHASIATTSAGGTISFQADCLTNAGASGGTQELGDGTAAFAGFTSADTGKPVRLTSGSTWATEWYRITAVTDTATASIANWDDSTEGYPIPNGDVLRGLYGGTEFTTDVNGDGKPTTQQGWGVELQAAIPTTVGTSSIYDQLTLLAERLDRDYAPEADRHFIMPFSGKPVLLQASELQPSGIEMLYNQTVVNGKIGRVANFDIHVTSGGRFSTKVGHSTTNGGEGASITLTTGTTGYLFPAFHKSFCSFAFKWSETRVVELEKQFGKAYQGLFLYGAKIPILRRSAGAALYSRTMG